MCGDILVLSVTNLCFVCNTTFLRGVFFFKNTLPHFRGVTNALEPHCSQQHAVFWLQQEVTSPEARFKPTLPEKSEAIWGAIRCWHILGIFSECKLFILRRRRRQKQQANLTPFIISWQFAPVCLFICSSLSLFSLFVLPTNKLKALCYYITLFLSLFEFFDLATSWPRGCHCW